ncbi:Hypothetical predicted protein, partial [Pelobates cultripes]
GTKRHVKGARAYRTRDQNLARELTAWLEAGPQFTTADPRLTDDMGRKSH